jgi:hypothetical protein
MHENYKTSVLLIFMFQVKTYQLDINKIITIQILVFPYMFLHHCTVMKWTLGVGLTAFCMIWSANAREILSSFRDLVQEQWRTRQLNLIINTTGHSKHLTVTWLQGCQPLTQDLPQHSLIIPPYSRSLIIPPYSRLMVMIPIVWKLFKEILDIHIIFSILP